MTAGELAVAAEHDLPIVVVVLNDAALTLIKLKQSKMQMDPRAVDFGSPRHAATAEGFGARRIRGETVADFDAPLRDAAASRQVTVICSFIAPDDYWEQLYTRPYRYLRGRVIPRLDTTRGTA